jgi:asparagine synthase (glutamine-hydrolysing)
MCGIAGIFGTPLRGSLSGIVTAMSDKLIHRGPDSSGVWSDDAVGVAFAHRRLAILDLSSNGHQPMRSYSGRFVITYNGEIYNHFELRRRIENEGGEYAWRGTSDTETLLAAFEHWGVDRALCLLNGMFALGVWDTKNRILILARDPSGEKPLYYGRVGQGFVFASEIKAIRTVPGWHSGINFDALDFFTRYSYIPAPHTIFEGLSKLEAGCYVKVTGYGRNVGEPAAYSNLLSVTPKPTSRPLLNEADAVEDLERSLIASVRARMMSDVPIGGLFSGGVDSTVIVALMQRLSPRPVRTFTVGFHESGFDESVYARALASYVGTEHHEIYVQPSDVLDLIPNLPALWDEPFGDPSQIPSYLIAKFARENVTVALSGDGGDELFCGYHHYSLANLIYRYSRCMPLWSRKTLATTLRAACEFIPVSQAFGAKSVDRLIKLGDLLSYSNANELIRKILSVYTGTSLVLGAQREVNLKLSNTREDLRQRLMTADLENYLPENIFTKSDRASMAVGLELRAPFLDPNVVDLARSLPLSLMQRNGVSKWVLREVLYRLVPRTLVDRPKAGFSVPIHLWLRGDLHNWAEDLLSQSSLRQSAVFDLAKVKMLWAEHQSGQRARQRVLWNVLMFQSWWFHAQCK